VGKPGATIAHEAEGAVLRRHELREVALLGLKPPRRGQVPAILLPRGSGGGQRLVVGLGHDQVDDEADHRRVTLQRQRAGSLMLFPRGAIARHGGIV